MQICEMSLNFPKSISIKDTKEIPSVNFSDLGELSCFRATSFMLSTSLLGLKLGLFELCRDISIITRYTMINVVYLLSYNREPFLHLLEALSVPVCPLRSSDIEVKYKLD